MDSPTGKPTPAIDRLLPSVQDLKDRHLNPRVQARRIGHLPCAMWQSLKHWWQRPADIRARQAVRLLFKGRTLATALFVSVFWLGALYIVEKLDPFGMSRAAENYSDGLVQKVVSSFYPAAGQDQVVVVLIDEATLHSRGESWPPRYAYYQDVVRRVIKQKPAVVFMDLLLEDRRSYDDSLEPARQSLRQLLANSEVPFYLAKLDPEAPGVFADIPKVNTALAGWSGHAEHYPLLVGPGHLYADGQRLNSQPDSDDEHCSVANSIPSAALQLYRAMCARGAAEHCAPANSEAFCQTMAIQWGRDVAPVVAERDLISSAQCSPDNPGWGVRLVRAAQSAFAALISGVDEQALRRIRQPCPYTITVKEEDLASEKVRGLLEGKAVLIGQSLPGIHDIVQSPVHGQIPGVYLHAMALDNLLNWDAGYFKAENSEWPKLLYAFFITWLCIAMFRADSPSVKFQVRLLVICLLALGSGLAYLAHRPAYDWLGLLIVYELANRMIEASEHTSTAHLPSRSSP